MSGERLTSAPSLSSQVHAYIISSLKKEMPNVFGKESKKKELVNNLGEIYQKIEREHQIDLEVQLCFQEVTLVRDSPFLEAGVSPKLPCHTSELRTMNNKKGLVRKPQPVRLSGVDSVFGRVITAQPPKWTGTFRVSDKSAFCKIISREHQWPTGLKEPQIQMTVTMCKQMLRSILLLYATYKKCTFALQHSK